MNNKQNDNIMKSIKEARYVTKRDGKFEKIELSKIEQRLNYLCSDDEKDYISICSIAVDASQSIYDKISTIELDNVSAQICASRASKHPFYETLGGRIVITNLHKETLNTFSDKVKFIHAHDKTFLKLQFVKFIKNNAHVLDSYMDYSRDLTFGYFACMTLIKSYLIKVNNKIVERPQDIFMRVAIAIHCEDTISIDEILSNIKNTYDYMSLGYFTHATPTLFNAGLRSGNLASCFLLGTDDSITGQYKTLGDCAQISKWAGGIGMHVSNVRGKNSNINSTKGITNGIVPMLKVFNETARYVNQSGRRNGSIAVYLEPWHSDILEFLDLRKPTGAEELRARDLFLALWVPDRFMQAVENKENWYLMSPDESPGLQDVYGEDFNKLYQSYIDQKKYREMIPAETIWKKILESQFETGVPYIGFKDAVNKYSNQKNIGTIKSSNLCVAPETIILTDKGYKEISTLKDQKVNIWNGTEFSEVEVKQTGENQKLIKVITSDGNELHCTPYHKFHIQNSYNVKDIIIREAKDLLENMKLIKCDYPIIKTGLNTFKYPYTAGLFSAEGTYTRYPEIHRCTYQRKDNEKYCMRHIDYKNYDNYEYHSIVSNTSICCAKVGLDKPKMTLYQDKMKLLEYIDKREECNIETTDKKLTVILPLDMPKKYTVPLDQNLEIKLKWFAGFIDGDGTIAVNGTNKQLQMTSIDITFLQNINHMLNTMGINGKVSKSMEETLKFMPDGHGGQKEYVCQKSYRLLLTSCDLYKLYKLGLKCHRLDFDNMEEPQRDAKQFIKISNVIDEDRYDDTYCFNEPKKHTGIFNGIIAGNCIEINEVSDHKRYSVCNLASIAVNKFVEDNKYNYSKLHNIVKQIVYNINRVIEITYYPTSECKHTNLSDRPMGIGIQGVADLFHILKLSYASVEAIELEQNIMETIYHACIETSCELAIKYGKYQYFDGSDLSKGIFHFEHYSTKPRIYNDWDNLKQKVITHGVRNSLMIALMPTASTSQILGNNECFEYFTSNFYTRNTQSGDFFIVNKYLVNDLIKIGLWNQNLKNKIIALNGSIQAIDEIPNEYKLQYKTIWEIKQIWVLKAALARAPFVDQTQSMNIYMAQPDFQRLSSSHFWAWKNGLKTGMYYLRSKPSSDAIKFTIDPSLLKNDEGCTNCSA